MARYDNKIRGPSQKIDMLFAINEINKMEGNSPECVIIFDSISKKKISKFDYKLCFDYLCTHCGAVVKNEFHFDFKKELERHLGGFLMHNSSISSH